MRRETIVRTLFWLVLAVALALALNPNPPQVPAFNDKSQHIALFAGLTTLALIAYPRAGWIALGFALSGFGALIEFLQMIPVLHRSSELLDWVADTAAILAVLAVAALLRWQRAT